MWRHWLVSRLPMCFAGYIQEKTPRQRGALYSQIIVMYCSVLITQIDMCPTNFLIVLQNWPRSSIYPSQLLLLVLQTLCQGTPRCVGQCMAIEFPDFPKSSCE